MANTQFDFPIDFSKENLKDARTQVAANDFNVFADAVTNSPKETAVSEASLRKLQALRDISARETIQDTAAGKAASLGTDSNVVRKVSTGAATAAADTFLDFPGRLIEMGGQYVEKGLDAVGLGGVVDRLNKAAADAGVTGPGTFMREQGKNLRDGAQEIGQAVDASAQNAIDNAQITGDITDPSSWDFGKDPNAEGYALQFADILGQFAPQAAGLLAGSPARVQTLMAGMGAAQVGSGQARDTENYIEQMTPDELEKQSQLYRDLRKTHPDMSPEEAKRQVKKTAGTTALFTGSLVGAAGGAATGYILKPLHNVLKGGKLAKAAKTTVVSGLEEGTQEVTETTASRAAVNADTGMNRDVTAGTLNDAVMGGGFGAGIGAGGGAANAAKDTVKAAGQKAAEERQKQADIDQVIATKADAGNFDELVKDTTMPADRVGLALYKVAQDENSTPEEKTKARKAMADLETRLNEDIKAAESNTATMDPEQRKQTRKKIKQVDALIQRRQEDGDAEGVTALQDIRQTLVDEVKAGQEATPEDRKAAQEKLASLKQARKAIMDGRENLSVTPETAKTRESLIQTATDTTRDTAERSQAAQSAVTLAMQHSNNMSADEARTLVDSAGDVLNDAQKSYLRSLTDAAVARNAAADLKTVHQDIFGDQGRTGFKSLPEYQSAVTAALEAGNVDAARQELDNIRAFAASHRTKANLAKQAVEQAGPGRQMALWSDPTADGGWRLLPGRGKADDKALRKNGGLQFSKAKKSQALAQSIETEARAIEATGKQLAAAIALADPESAKKTAEPTAAKEQAQATEESANVTETASQTDQRPEETQAPEAAASSQSEARGATQTRTGTDSQAGNGDKASGADRATVDAKTGRDNGRPEPVEPAGAYGLTFTPVDGAMTNEVFQQTNLLEAYFSPRKTGEGQTRQPLTTKPRFVTEVLNPTVEEQGGSLAPLADYVSGLGEAGSELAEKQRRLLRLFGEKAAKWHDLLNTRIFKPKTNPKFRYEDFVQFLAQDNKLPENVTAAISAAAFTWAQENGNERALNDDAAIRAILSKKDNEIVTTAEKDLLQKAGTYEDNVIADLGRRASQALGLKLNANAPQNHQAQLEGALGVYALDVLIQEGVIERHALKSPLLKGDGSADHWFVRLNRDYGRYPYPLAEDVQAIVDAGKGTHGILQNLFSVEARVKGPSFEPLKRTQQTTKGTNETIPSEQKAIIENEMANTAWTLRSDMKQLVDTLRTELGARADTLLNRMAGAVDLENYTPQASNEASLRGKNEGLEREVKHLLDFYEDPAFQGEDGLSKRFYFPLSVWVNQRVGIDTNTINPLSSKVHRFMMQLPEWTHEIETNPTTEAEQHKLRQFKLAALEGLGYSVDKLSNDTALAAFDKEVAKAQPHIDTLTKLMTGQAVEPKAVTAMAEFVGNEEQFHTLDALVHLSRYQQAGERFTSTLVREGDGITNGPALATILSGAWGSLDEGLALVNKMGFFNKGNKHQSAGAWQEDPSNNDLYETLADRVDTLVQDDYRDAPASTKAKYFAIFSLMGSFRDADNSVSKKGRKRVKTPLTGMAFGASPEKSIQNMGHDLVDIFFEDLEKALNDPDTRAGNARIKGLVHAMNTLLPADQKLTVKNRKQAQMLTMSAAQRNRVVAEFEQSVGRHVNQALEEQFGDFITFRNKMNKMASHAYKMFMLVREKERQAFLTEQDIPVNRAGQPLQDLTRTQERELNKRLQAVNPVLHTAMSKASSELKSGLHISGTEMTQQYGNPAYLAKASFRKAFPVSNASDGNATKKTLDIYGKTMGYGDPGVRMFITGVHSLDSAIASRTYKDYPALNVHDAEIVAAYMMQEVASRMNQETFKALRDYSLPTEVMQMVSRVYDGFAEQLDSLDPAEVKKTFPKGLTPVQQDIATAFQAANTAEANKLSLLAQIETVNQYGVEGGEYHLTAEDYASIEEKQKTTVVDRVVQSLTKGGRSSTVAENLSDWLAGNTREPERPQPLPNNRTVWGKLGRSVTASDPAIVSSLENNPQMTVKELLSSLPRTPLTVAVGRLLPDDLAVKYITKDTPASELPDTDVSRARGFWTKDNGREFVGIKSPDYVDSGATAELVTHEALHAVLFHVVDQAKQRQGSAEARRFVRELEQLRGRMIEHLTDAGLMEQYGNAVQNTHEMIAWGMTNTGFQREMARVKFQTQNNGLVSAFVGFINSIKRVLFRNKVPANSGLESLIVNTAGLMTEASRSQQTSNSTTLKQEFGPTPEDMHRWTTEQVYDGLGNADNLDPATDSRLRELLNTVVEKVHGPYGAWVAPEGLNSPAEVFTEAKATGQMPFASEALTVFPLSDRQAYVLEQMEVSLRESMASDSLAYKDLVRTFKAARDRIQPSDLSSDPVIGRQRYNYLFNLRQANGTDRTNHLSRFAALALVEPNLYEALNGTSVQPHTAPSDKIGDRLRSWFEQSMQGLSDRLNNTYEAQPDNARIQALGERLADIEAKNRADVARNAISAMDQVEAAGEKLSAKVREKVAKAANKAAEKSDNIYVQAIGELTSTVAEDRVQELLDTLEAYRASKFKTRQGPLGALVTELRGATKETEIFHKLLRMAGQNERERKQINESVRQDVRERFENLDKEASEAITRTMLRTDMSALTEHYSVERLEKLVANPQELQREINKWEQKVARLNHHEKHYLAYAKLLGHFMATGEAKGPHMSLNAHNIAALYGTDEPALSETKVNEAEEVLDPLISLYALKATDLNSRLKTAEVMRQESAKGTQSGVVYTLRLHEKLKDDARVNLFDGDRSLFMKGYTREIYNPHREVTVATVSEGRELEQQGWIRQPDPLSVDPNDPNANEPRYLYMLSHGGLNARVTGSMSLTGTRRKGSAIHGGEFLISENEVHRGNQQTNQQLKALNKRGVQQVVAKGRGIDPQSINENYLVPVYNQAGEISTYRYLMTENNKDVLLQRNNRVEDVLGSMASHLFDKVETPKQNRLVVEALKGFHDIEYQRRPGSFIKVGPDSNDQQARETYHLLPSSTKLAIREVWGGNSMWVRADMYDMVFGYRKFSLSDRLDKDATERAAVDTVLQHTVETILAMVKRFNGRVDPSQAKLRARQFEDVWQELVKEVKDSWVIKNLTTLLGNIKSNISILIWSGMNPKAVVETHKTAINGLLQYQEETTELMSLQRELDLGVAANPAKAQQRVLELKDSMDRNPIKPLIDAGMFQTIIEDVDAEVDDYSYKTRLVEKMEKASENLPKHLKTAGRWAYLAHDTPAYKLLFKATQMSDFVARYSLYTHLTTRKRKPMGHDQAIQRISEAFVNYDIPSHRTLQYLNDVGLVFFTKYYLRIQKVLMTMYQEKPLRGLMLAMADNYFSGVTTVMDSGPRLSNPLDVGALNLPGAMSEIFPIKFAMNLW